MKKIIILFLSICFSYANAQKRPQNNLPLPEIKELKYLSISTALERIFPPNSCQDNLINLVKFYNNRLADINGYEVYLVKQSCDFSENTCLCFETTAQGTFDFLILFNRKLKEANILVASYTFLSDSEVYDMNFKIKNNEIKLMESGFTDNENGSAEKFSEGLHKIQILKSGQIRIVSPKE